MSASNSPDYSGADHASTSDGRVISWGLADVAHEMRTANLIAVWKLTPTAALGREIFARLGLEPRE